MRRPFFPVLILLLASVPCLAQPRADTTAAPAGPDWQPFDEALADAREHGSAILIDVYAPWCGWCRKMQREVYTDEHVLSLLDASFEATRLNVDDTQSTLSFRGMHLSPQELGNAFGATGTPTTVFLNADGLYITRLPGFVDAATFRQILSYIGSGAYRDQTLEEFVDASAPTN